MQYEGVTFKKGEMVIPTMLRGLDEHENPHACDVNFNREQVE